MSIKLKENEIEALQGFQKRTQDVITDLGKIELQMSELEDVKAKVKETKETKETKKMLGAFGEVLKVQESATQEEETSILVGGTHFHEGYCSGGG